MNEKRGEAKDETRRKKKPSNKNGANPWRCTHTHTHTHTHVVLKDSLIRKRNTQKKSEKGKETNVGKKLTFINDVKKTRKITWLVYLAFFRMRKREEKRNGNV